MSVCRFEWDRVKQCRHVMLIFTTPFPLPHIFTERLTLSFLCNKCTLKYEGYGVFFIIYSCLRETHKQNDVVQRRPTTLLYAWRIE